MQSDQQFYTGRAAPGFANRMGNNYMNIPVAPDFGAVLPPGGMPMTPFHGIEFQASEVCPKNFIIFDQTDHRSQIMFHPAIAHKFSGPAIDIHATYGQENFERKDVNHGDREFSILKEDSDDIDALLSSEEEEQEECDEEEVSTGRTYGNYGSNSPDSCSNYGSNPKKISSSSFTVDSSGSGTERKRKKMKKMVKALRGIVPGGDQMNTVTVLDEAVRYLKSLKVEVQKLGVSNFRN